MDRDRNRSRDRGRNKVKDRDMDRKREYGIRIWTMDLRGKRIGIEICVSQHTKVVEGRFWA